MNSRTPPDPDIRPEYQLSKSLLEITLDEFQNRLDKQINWFNENFDTCYRDLTPLNEQLFQLFQIAVRTLYVGNQVTHQIKIEDHLHFLILPHETQYSFEKILETLKGESLSFLSYFTAQDQTVRFLTYQIQPSQLEEFRRVAPEKSAFQDWKSRKEREFQTYWDSQETDRPWYEWCDRFELTDRPALNVVFADVGEVFTLKSIFGFLKAFGLIPKNMMMWKVYQNDRPFLWLHIDFEKDVVFSQRLKELFEMECLSLSLLDPKEEIWKYDLETFITFPSEYLLLKIFADWSALVSPMHPHYPEGLSTGGIFRKLLKYPHVLQVLISLCRRKCLYEIAEEDLHLQTHVVLETIRNLPEKYRFFYTHILNWIQAVVRTNLTQPSSAAISFLLNPPVLGSSFFRFQDPYAIYYIVGRHFFFMHMRFDEVARGGLRLVRTKNEEDFWERAHGMIREVEGLSWAQTLKNVKDIPEGGAKAITILGPHLDPTHTIKILFHSFLDLLIYQKPLNQTRFPLDEWKKVERVYLGPDENISPQHITWMIDVARRRGWTDWKTIMSSKLDFGINHKEYGVTSEGVFVYMDTFRKAQFPDKKSIKIKITGGPRGDVSGNLLKILHQNWGEEASIVFLNDSQGAVWDPQGLHWNELLRLVREQRSVVEYNPSLLEASPHAGCDRDVKQSLFRMGQIESDIFVPCGGRAYSITEDNVHILLLPDGSPSMSLIVEGANIFFTSQARTFLEKKGVTIIKDSSANKTGVITSSFEILACSIWEPEEFLVHKKIYVDQVLSKIRQTAYREAQTLLSLVESSSLSFVEASERLSKVCREYRVRLNLVLQEHRSWLDSSLARQILEAYVPPILVHQDQLRLQQLPESYRQAMVNVFMVGRWVYAHALTQVPPFQNLDDWARVVLDWEK